MPGIFLRLKSLVEDFGRDDVEVDEDLPDPDAIIQVIGTDHIAVLEDQLTFPLAALDAQNAGLSGRVQQLDDVDDRQVFQVSGKRHRLVSSLRKAFTCAAAEKTSSLNTLCAVPPIKLQNEGMFKILSLCYY